MTGAGVCLAKLRLSSRDVVTFSAVKWKIDVISASDSGKTIDESNVRYVKSDKNFRSPHQLTSVNLIWLPFGSSYCANGVLRLSKSSCALACEGADVTSRITAGATRLFTLRSIFSCIT